MWYNTLPPFVPMDPNTYPTYYSRIEGLDPSIVGRKGGTCKQSQSIKIGSTC
jgi:hypothetical protein